MSKAQGARRTGQSSGSDYKFQGTTETLRSEGVELTTGDLKDAGSIASACRGIETLISAAGSRLTPQPGDSIESVDAAGRLNLVNAAKDANVRRFILVSFRSPRIRFPLSDATREVIAA
jgi:uncharacterized protein YbjT (DUF2867 family)